MLRLLLTCMVALCAGCSANYRPAIASPPWTESRPLFFRNVRVFVGDDDETQAARDVWVEGGRIRNIQATGELPTPGDACVLEWPHVTLLPGLIDTHVHAIGTASPPWRFRLPDAEHNLEAWLYSGVTTIADMGGPPADLDELSARVREGTLPGPRILRGTLPFTAPGGHPIPAARALLPWPLNSWVAGTIPTLSTPQAARRAVRAAHADGSLWLKLILDDLPPGAPKLDELVLQAAIDEAHLVGMRAFVHVDTNESALAAVRAGADHLAHGVYEEAISDELVTELSRRHVSVTYTAAAFALTRALAEGRWQPSALARATASHDDELAPVTGDYGKRFAGDATLGPFVRSIASPEVLRDNVRRLFDAGVTVLAGSDGPVAGVLPGAALHAELQFFEAAGVAPYRVLQSATADAARWLERDDLGRVAAGARADLLIVRGDPTLGVRALEEIVGVVRAGRWVRRLVPMTESGG